MLDRSWAGSDVDDPVASLQLFLDDQSLVTPCHPALQVSLLSGIQDAYLPTLIHPDPPGGLPGRPFYDKVEHDACGEAQAVPREDVLGVVIADVDDSGAGDGDATGLLAHEFEHVGLLRARVRLQRCAFMRMCMSIQKRGRS